MKAVIPILIALLATPLEAETIVATRTIRSQTILTANDVELIDQNIPGTYISTDEVVGMETRVVLYAGRPVRIDDIGPPAIIDRNQIVSLYFTSGGLTIATEARSLARAGVGDRIRVINLASRSTVSGWVGEDGNVYVGNSAISSQ
ncbi:MAG TPA: flagellar basal body P-ring formation protein FlgA [Aliiroseovarius sp.]|nr:flagellar basal body P-ring formation protein FlgA [Aliiroseovarius sp.]